MEVTRQELEQHFSDLTDEALQAQLSSGTLTALALEIAQAEARSRHLALPKPRIAPPQTDAPPPEGQVILAGFPDPTEAYIIVGFLQDHGIAASVADGNTLLMNFLWSPAMGGTRVMVPKAQLQKATELVKERDEGKFKLTDAETESLEDADADADMDAPIMDPGTAGVITLKAAWIIIAISAAFAMVAYTIVQAESPAHYFHRERVSALWAVAIYIAFYAFCLWLVQRKFQARRHSADQEAAPLNAKDYFREARRAGEVYVAMRAGARRTIKAGRKEILPSWSSESRARQAVNASRVFAGCTVAKLPLAAFLQELRDSASPSSVGLNWQGRKATGMDKDKADFLDEMAKHD